MPRPRGWPEVERAHRLSLEGVFALCIAGLVGIAASVVACVVAAFILLPFVFSAIATLAAVLGGIYAWICLWPRTVSTWRSIKSWHAFLKELHDINTQSIDTSHTDHD